MKVTSGRLFDGGAGNVVGVNSEGNNAGKLGIAMYLGYGVNENAKLMIGEGFNGYGYPVTTGVSNPNTANSFLTITAVPYKKADSVLDTGSFNASILLTFLYL